jgi:hypothetical protein
VTGFEYPESRGHPDLSSLIAQAACPPPCTCVSVVLVGVLTCMGDRDLRVRLKNPGARNEYLEVLNSHLRNEGLQVLIRRFLYLGWRCSTYSGSTPESNSGHTKRVVQSCTHTPHTASTSAQILAAPKKTVQTSLETSGRKVGFTHLSVHIISA